MLNGWGEQQLKIVVLSVFVLLSIMSIILYMIAYSDFKKYEKYNSDKYYQKALVIFKISLITFIIGLLTLFII